MTCLARISQKWAPALRQNRRNLSKRVIGTERLRMPERDEIGSNNFFADHAQAAASYTAPMPAVVTNRGDQLNYSPYLPAAGLYSLFSDSFGPVP
jgi:hypothetical protein